MHVLRMASAVQQLSQPYKYTSPALEVAAHPVYSEIFCLQPTKEPTNRERNGETFAQIVFEVRVEPGYRIQPNTLSGRRHWHSSLQIDPRFHTFLDLEWLTENSSSVVLSAILVRQFGKRPSILSTPTIWRQSRFSCYEGLHFKTKLG